MIIQNLKLIRIKNGVAVPLGELSTKSHITRRVPYSDFSHTKAPLFMEITRDQLIDINELIGDTAEYYCNENLISGEKFYTVLECYATAKLAELRGELG